jgi:hypothetical protein
MVNEASSGWFNIGNSTPAMPAPIQKLLDEITLQVTS